MKTNQGFIKWIIIIVVAVLILSYYGFDIQRAIESPTTQHNFSYIQKIAWTVWNNYLKGIFEYLWNQVVIKLIHQATTR